MTDYTRVPKRAIISPEELELNTFYATTWNPSDKYQYFGNPKRIELLTEITERMIIEFPNTDLHFNMEVSRAGRLHFHGTIRWKSYTAITDFFINRVPELIDKWNIDMTPITDPSKWVDYCTKSRNIIFVKISTKDALNKYRKVKVDKNGVKHMPYFGVPLDEDSSAEASPKKISDKKVLNVLGLF